MVATFDPGIRTTPSARVLLADNHPAMLDAAADTLLGECAVVGKVADGLELVTAVENLAPEIVVLDISMPRLGGFEAARRIHRSHPAIALVFLTIHDDPDFASAAFDAGALGYVVKSRIATDLLPAVREARAGRTFLSPLLQPEKPK